MILTEYVRLSDFPRENGVLLREERGFGCGWNEGANSRHDD